MGELKGLFQDYSTSEEPDFESLLNSDGSSPKPLREVAFKGMERIRALFRLLAYWTPERLELLGLRHALNWHSPLRLGRQYEQAYLHYLGWVDQAISPYQSYEDRTAADLYKHQISHVHDLYPSLLRELRERIEFVYHRADLHRDGHLESLAVALYQRERDQAAKSLARVIILLNLDTPSLTEGIKPTLELFERQPELGYLPSAEVSDLKQRVYAELKANPNFAENKRGLQQSLTIALQRATPIEASALENLSKFL